MKSKSNFCCLQSKQRKCQKKIDEQKIAKHFANFSNAFTQYIVMFTKAQLVGTGGGGYVFCSAIQYTIDTKAPKIIHKIFMIQK